MAYAGIFTASNAKLRLDFGTVFTMIGFETATPSQQKRNQVVLDPNQTTSGIASMQGGNQASQLDVVCSIEEKDLLNTLNTYFDSRVTGFAYITHKEDPDRNFIFEGRVLEPVYQQSVDDSIESKITFSLVGRITSNTW